jgi:hypothetical protein
MEREMAIEEEKVIEAEGQVWEHVLAKKTLCKFRKHVPQLEHLMKVGHGLSISRSLAHDSETSQ